MSEEILKEMSSYLGTRRLGLYTIESPDRFFFLRLVDLLLRFLGIDELLVLLLMRAER